MAAAYEARHGRDVRGFIDMATAELEAEAREPDAPVDLGGLDAVRLMTIHAAKGLEFPVVVVADLGRRGNLSPPDLHVNGERVGLRLVGLDGSRATALDFDAIEAERRAADEAEERRVMHVAMTRAEERLILSGAVRLGDSWPQPGPGAAPISWIAPALVPDVAACCASKRRCRWRPESSSRSPSTAGRPPRRRRWVRRPSSPRRSPRRRPRR
jgi:ATP-dependent helicase/nuclease subunit A